MADKKADEFYITRPPTLSRGQEFIRFLYNPSTHEVLGRTAKSWLQITVFYIVLYAFLAGFFAGLLAVFYQTLDANEPTWQLDKSLIGTNPGMGFRPEPETPDHMIISFTPGDKGSETIWKNSTNKFLEPYYTAGANTEGYNTCNYGPDPPKDKPCRFEVKLDKCREPYGYGDTNTPCIFLKLNKIFGWVPDCYTKEEIDAVEDMPDSLKTEIRKLPADVASQNVWVSCTTSTDNELEKNITMAFDGHFGFPKFYFPFTGNKDVYRAPFVALQISDLPEDITVRVSCRLWAKNISVDRQRRLGMTNLEMLSNKKKS